MNMHIPINKTIPHEFYRWGLPKTVSFDLICLQALTLCVIHEVNSLDTWAIRTQIIYYIQCKPSYV